MTAPGPNPEQSAAIAHGDGPLRIMAGAGTGKTYTLTQRIAGLVQSGRAKPSQILALTFTNKATDELRERIDPAIAQIAGTNGERVDIDTYHAFGGRIVTEHGIRLGLPPEPLLLTSSEAWILLWRALDEVDFRHIELQHLRGYTFMRSPLFDMLNLSSRMRDELVTHDDLQAFLESAPPDDTIEKLADYLRALRVYEARKQAIGAIDFGDQIALACALLNDPAVAATYRSRYRYLLVDEFQDTNFAQSVLVQRLAGAPDANVCVVGDPNQAIYGFRGASPDNLDRFAAEEFKAAVTVELRQNFRSTQAILDVANAVWESDPGPYRGNLIAADQKHAPAPRLVECAAVADEIAFIANEIQRKAANGRAYKQIAVIVRKNAMKQLIFHGLRSRQIPCEMVGGTSLFETPEVRELISYLRVIGDPGHDPSLAHVLCSERWGLDERALYELSQVRKRGERLHDTASRLVAEGNASPALSECLTTLATLTAKSYRIGLARLVEGIAACRRGGYDPVELANVQRFTVFVRTFTESRVERPTLADLLAYLDLLLISSPDEEAAGEFDSDVANTVKIMTAHASKGLEWPVVFVAGANENDFRNRPSTDLLPEALAHPLHDRPRKEDFPEDTHKATAYDNAITAWRKSLHNLEELRVLYVALTRAQETLTITWSRTKPGRKRDSVLLKALTPAVPHCTAIVAEPSDLPDARTPAFREIASNLLASVSPLLASDRSPSGEIVAALREPWARAGGDPGVLAAATDRFVVLRTSTQETIEVIRAVESRRPSAQEERLASDGAISYTQLETFKACPHRFYLRYVAGMPSPPSRRTTAIGTAFHHAIATEAARRGSGKSVDEAAVRGWFETEVRQTAGDDAPSAGGGRDFVGNYLASPDATAEPLLIEEAFSLKFGETILRGVVDRVHRLPDGSTEVVDYKTDRVARSEAEVRAGWQLPIYLIACREVFKEIQPTPARAVMFFVGANARIGVTYSDAELTTIQREIELTAVQLREVKPGEHKASEGACRQCEYRSICRFKV